MRRQHPDDRPSYGYQPSQRDDVYKAKRQRPNSRLPPGELCGMSLGWYKLQCNECKIKMILMDTFVYYVTISVYYSLFPEPHSLFTILPMWKELMIF